MVEGNIVLKDTVHAMHCVYKLRYILANTSSICIVRVVQGAFFYCYEYIDRATCALCTSKLVYHVQLLFEQDLRMHHEF